MNPKPKYFYKHGDVAMLYATYPNDGYYAAWTNAGVGEWARSRTLNTAAFINDPDYAPVSWKDVRAAYPFHSPHKLKDSVKEQQLPQTCGTESAT